MRHFLELRKRMLYVLSLFILVFVVFFNVAPQLFHYYIQPLLKALPPQSGLIATDVSSPLFIPIKLAADLAMLCTTPVALWHAWKFAAPGLYLQERRYLSVILWMSSCLFLLGVVFCFYLILPCLFHFFAKATPFGVKFMPDMGSAADFITRMLLIFGVGFQIPLLSLILIKVNIISITTLKNARPYFIVAAFTMGMLLTPPDVLSQILVAVPLCAMYESGIFLARILIKKSNG